MSPIETRITADVDHVPFSRSQAAPFNAILPDRLAGVVHDLGNLIQIAASALNIISSGTYSEFWSGPGVGCRERHDIPSTRRSAYRADDMPRRCRQHGGRGCERDGLPDGD